MVVWGPCPDSTTVESSSGRHTRASDSNMSSMDPPGRSVRPMEPANSRSPEKNTDGMSAVSGIRKVTDPLVWPGACATENWRPARSRVVPFVSSRTSSGSPTVSSPISGIPMDRPSAFSGSLIMYRSSGWIQAGTSCAPQTGTTEATWSMCPWVRTTATGLSRCFFSASSTPSAAWWPGSMITHSSPAAGATR